MVSRAGLEPARVCTREFLRLFRRPFRHPDKGQLGLSKKVWRKRRVLEPVGKGSRFDPGGYVVLSVKLLSFCCISRGKPGMA